MATDPSSLLLKQVKIHSVSAKPELNGKVGVAQSYIPDRNRYLVTLPTPSQTVALRPENLSPATMVDKARAKAEETWTMAQTIYKDERFREELRRAYTSVDQRLPANVNPKQVGFVLLLLFLGLIYMLGVTRTFMLLSLILMGGVVAMPDVIAKRDAKTIARNFPNRWRDAIEQNTGYKPTPNVANAILVAMLLVSGKVLLTSTAPRRAPSSAPPMMSKYDGVGTTGAGATGSIIPFTMEEVYKMGYDDAQDEKNFGESLPIDHLTMTFSSSSATSSSSQFDYSDYESYAPPPPPAPKSKFGFGTIMALFALGRTVKELGFVNGKFEKDFFLANVKNLPPLKMGFLALMGYRVLTAFT